MASGISSTLGIAGVLLIIIGIIMAVIGVVFLISNQNREKPWYIWLLLIGGVVLGIIGGIMLAIALSERKVSTCCPTPIATMPVATTSVRSETVGYGTLDPDPRTTSYITQGAPQHVTASGPYGPGGSQATVQGVLTPALTRNYVTSDISPHAVVATNT